MLYILGPLQLDTEPMGGDMKVARTASGDYATKPVIGGLKPREATGEGDDVITISGKLLPFKLGGLTELDLADNYRRLQQALPCQRGDGKSLGWRVIDELQETHEELDRDGVGLIVTYSFKLTKVPTPGVSQGGSVISVITSLFGILGR